MSGCGCGCGEGVSCVCACPDYHLEPPFNRPGLDAIDARLGDYRDFFGNAIDQLSDASRVALRDLGTRELSDPAIAWLDAWAVVADVLTFYRERLTNDSYLRTTTDELALRELAALVGYTPRPGVAATAFLAYLMDPTVAPVTIGAGAKAQTVPGPGEQMQTFETEEAFVAQSDWSQMAARTTQPSGISLVQALTRPAIRLAGTTLVVKPGDRVLFLFGNELAHQIVREVAAATPDIMAGYVEVTLKPRFLSSPDVNTKVATTLETLRDDITTAGGKVADALVAIIASFFLGGSAADAKSLVEDTIKPPPPVPAPLKALGGQLAATFEDVLRGTPPTQVDAAGSQVDGILDRLDQKPRAQLASANRQLLNAGEALTAHGSDRLALISRSSPELATTLGGALNALPVTPAPVSITPSVHLLRMTASSFETFAPPRVTASGAVEHSATEAGKLDLNSAFLDAVYDGIRPNSYVVLDRPDNVTVAPVGGVSTQRTLQIARVRAAQTVTRRAWDMSGKTTRLELVPLHDPRNAMPVMPLSPDIADNGHLTIAFLRSLLFHVQSEPVRLAGDVIETDVMGPAIELQTRVDRLRQGQWLIVAGERTDILDGNKKPVPGLRAAELVMIALVDQEATPKAPGDSLHTKITFEKPLAYSYKRSTTVVYGNVVKATHGEVVNEALGSGDATRAGQRFSFKRGPLTFTTAPTPFGAQSSEILRVNGLRYDRVESLLDAGPTDRAYTLDLDGSGLATLTFGDGTLGARLPSGSQNVRASYRVAIGSPGNVRAEQISLLTTRPLGVTAVVNPLRASGGADPDTPEQIRQNIPIVTRGLSTLGRLVSVDDYANFARRFAGIGKADAVHISDGAQQMVYVTVTGVDDSTLDPDGEVLQNLRTAYDDYGDPAYPVEIGVRDLKILIIEARVAVAADADWDDVQPLVRARLIDAFGFMRRRLGQPAYLSEAIAVMQTTPGVAWLDMDRFGAIAESQIKDSAALAQAMKDLTLSPVIRANRAEVNHDWPLKSADRFLPSQLIRVVPGVPTLLVLNLAVRE